MSTGSRPWTSNSRPATELPIASAPPMPAHGAERDRNHSLSEHQADDLRAACAEGDAQVHLAAAPRDPEGGHRVDTDDGDEEPDRAEDDEQPRLIPPAGDRRVGQLLQRTGLTNGDLRIDLANGAAHARDHRRWRHRRLDQQRHRGPASPPVRDVDHQRLAAIERRRARVGDDADDLEPLLGGHAAAEALADRILARPETRRRRPRHQGRRRALGIALGVRERTSALDGDAERAEEVGCDEAEVRGRQIGRRRGASFGRDEVDLSLTAQRQHRRGRDRFDSGQDANRREHSIVGRLAARFFAVPRRREARRPPRARCRS